MISDIEDYDIAWYKDGEIIETSTDLSLKKSHININNNKLIFINIQPHDAGFIQCFIKTKDQVKQQTARLVITGKEKIHHRLFEMWENS